MSFDSWEGQKKKKRKIEKKKKRDFFEKKKNKIAMKSHLISLDWGSLFSYCSLFETKKEKKKDNHCNCHCN